MKFGNYVCEIQELKKAANSDCSNQVLCFSSETRQPSGSTYAVRWQIYVVLAPILRHNSYHQTVFVGSIVILLIKILRCERKFAARSGGYILFTCPLYKYNAINLHKLNMTTTNRHNT